MDFFDLYSALERYSEFKVVKDRADLRKKRRDKRKAKNKPIKPKAPFKDGITEEEFEEIAYDVMDKFDRIIDIAVEGAVVTGLVSSQSGSSVWGFEVNFNMGGHITGAYRCKTENSDSNIATVFGYVMSAELQSRLE